MHSLPWILTEMSPHVVKRSHHYLHLHRHPKYLWTYWHVETCDSKSLYSFFLNLLLWSVGCTHKSQKWPNIPSIYKPMYKLFTNYIHKKSEISQTLWLCATSGGVFAMQRHSTSTGPFLRPMAGKWNWSTKNQAHCQTLQRLQELIIVVNPTIEAVGQIQQLRQGCLHFTFFPQIRSLRTELFEGSQQNHMGFRDMRFWTVQQF